MFIVREGQGQRKFLSAVMSFILRLGALWKEDALWSGAGNHVFL
jgi:hypothetical protein